MTIKFDPKYSDQEDDLHRYVADWPRGMYANINAIPWEDRCPLETFNRQEGYGTGAYDGMSQPDYLASKLTHCPASSRIGSIRVMFRVFLGSKADEAALGGSDNVTGAEDFTSDNPTRCSNIRSKSLCSAPLYLLQSSPDLPAKVGALMDPFTGISRPIRVVAETAPTVTSDGDLRLRQVTGAITRLVDIVDGQAAGWDRSDLKIRIEKLEQNVWGRLPTGAEATAGAGACQILTNYKFIGWGSEFIDPSCRTGKAFLTNPSSCSAWDSDLYARGWDTNASATEDLLDSGQTFTKLAPKSVTPDCSNPQPSEVQANAAFSNTPRDGHPSLDVDVSVPNYGTTDFDTLGGNTPKSIVTTLPQAVNVDVDRIRAVCEVVDFEARRCADTARVGNVWIKTPLITNGLRGDVFMVRNTGSSNLPRLGLEIHGEVNFNVLSSTRYVGPDFDQIETTFDNIPQIGFQSLRLRIDGGDGGLLKVKSCKADGAFTNDGGAVSFAVTGYNGQANAAASAPFTPNDCFSNAVSIKAPTKCVKGKSFSISPVFESPAEVSQVTITSSRSKGSTDKSAPFKVTVKVGKKVKKNKKTKFKVKVYFKDQAGNKVPTVTKTGYFKRCK